MSIYVYGVAFAFFFFGLWNTGKRNDRECTYILGGGKILQQGVGIVAVDVFILISGWFSIKPKIISIATFYFKYSF